MAAKHTPKPTTKGRQAARKAWRKRRIKAAWLQAHAAEKASKAAFEAYFKKQGWRVAFFEGNAGTPRTGIIDAVAFRLGRKNADLLELWLVQLKGGRADVSGPEIARLVKAADAVTVKPLIAAFDGETLQILLPDEPDA